MIRRLWRWLTADHDHTFLTTAAEDLAAELRTLTGEQQRDLLTLHPRLWWHVHRVAACIDLRTRTDPFEEIT